MPSASTAGPVTAHITDVQTDTGDQVDWVFDTNVASVGNAAGFLVNGAPGLSIVVISTNTVTVQYLLGHTSGEPWIFNAALAAVVFSPASTIANASGTTS